MKRFVLKERRNFSAPGPILIVAFALALANAAHPAESQMLDPLQSAAQNGERVIVEGRVERVAPEVGRLGSRYFEISLRAESGIVRVFARALPPCKTLLVEGIWRESGWYGGYPYDQFVEARAMNCWK